MAAGPRLRGAGRAIGDRNDIPDGLYGLFTIDTWKREVDNLWDGKLRIAMNDRLQGAERFHQTRPKVEALFRALGRLRLRQLRGLSQSYDKRYRKRSRSQAKFLSSPIHQGRERRSFPVPTAGNQRTDPFRRIDL